MKTKISKSQVEVWEWKEKASKELSGIQTKDIIEFIKKNVSELKKDLLINNSCTYKNENDNLSIVADK